MMQTYKWVGADLVLQLPDQVNPLGTESTEVMVKGRLRYFAPTKGRCDALRDAYHQLREAARGQAVDFTKNKLFDFRVLPRSKTNYINNIVSGPPTQDKLYNLTTLDGLNELAMIDHARDDCEVFTTYNAGVQPVQTSVTASNFSSGLRRQIGTVVTQTDFVLDEGEIQTGNSNFADVKMEEIPFTLVFDSNNYRTMSLQWRPDPALYVSVLGGFVECVLDEVIADGATGGMVTDGIEMDISMHWAGWKSIVKPPKSRKMLSERKTNRSKK